MRERSGVTGPFSGQTIREPAHEDKSKLAFPAT